jgi:hypothetical protein
MTSTATNTAIELRALELVPVGFKFTGDENIAPRITDLIERGKRISFTKEEVSISGSPLFNHIMGGAEEVLVQMGATVAVTTSLRYYRNPGSNPMIAQLEAIPSDITAGRSRLTLEIRAADFPLDFSVEMARDFTDKHLTCQFGFSVDKWYGHPLLGLPYFEQMKRFAQSLLQRGRLEFVCLYKGNHLFTGSSTRPFPKTQRLADFIAFLDKARFVAKQLGLNPTFKRLTERDYTDIENLYELFSRGEYSTRVKGLQMSATILAKPELLDTPGFADSKTPRQLLLNYEN